MNVDAIPPPKFIPRLPRQPRLAQNAQFVPGERVAPSKLLLSPKEKALQREKLRCINDLQPFKGEPFYIPNSFDETYVCEDAACGPRCAISFILEDKHTNPQIALPLLAQYAGDVFGLWDVLDTFEPAPPRSVLARRELSLEKYRGQIKLVNRKPWLVSVQTYTMVSQNLTAPPAALAPAFETDLCICDMQPFSTKPFKIPFKFDDRLGKFEFVEGEVACGPRCAMRHILSAHFCAHIVVPLVNQYAREFGCEAPVAPSPPRSALARGLLTLDEFRGKRTLVSLTLSLVVCHGVTTQQPFERGNPSLAALAAAGVHYSEASDVLPHPADICAAIVRSIKDKDKVHSDTFENDVNLEAVGEPARRRSMGMTIERTPRRKKTPSENQSKPTQGKRG